jgi:hypothetical protein
MYSVSPSHTAILEANDHHRCPIECQLTQTPGDWSCRIQLRWSDTSKDPTEFGGLVTDKAELERMIRRAQFAVLNPKVPAAQFLSVDPNSTDTRSGQLSFSDNVICLDIKAPEIPDLTFIDLPGEYSTVVFIS